MEDGRLVRRLLRQSRWGTLAFILLLSGAGWGEWKWKGNPKWNQETLQMNVSGRGWFELEDPGDTQVPGGIGQRGCSSLPCGRRDWRAVFWLLPWRNAHLGIDFILLLPSDSCGFWNTLGHITQIPKLRKWLQNQELKFKPIPFKQVSSIRWPLGRIWFRHDVFSRRNTPKLIIIHVCGYSLKSTY